MKLDFDKGDGLLPAIVQDSATCRVLMLGFMNREAYRLTVETEKVTFYSRTRGRLWQKGERSGNFLQVTGIIPDCDNDTLLIKARPAGPVCHTGEDTCFGEDNFSVKNFLWQLEDLIRERGANPSGDSYTSYLLGEGAGKIARKVGEEACETVIEAVGGEDSGLVEESADLIYHLLVLLACRGISLNRVIGTLYRRHTGAVK